MINLVLQLETISLLGLFCCELYKKQHRHRNTQKDAKHGISFHLLFYNPVINSNALE